MMYNKCNLLQCALEFESQYKEFATLSRFCQVYVHVGEGSHNWFWGQESLPTLQSC